MLPSIRLRALRAASLPSVAVRASSTAATSSASSTPAPPAGKSKNAEVKAGETGESAGRRRRKYKIPTTRPAISLANPRPWNPPLKKGVVPAYDLAVEYLKADAAAVASEASALEKEIDAKEAEYQALKAKGDEVEALDAELEKMREKLVILKVQSEVNLPEVRWKVANAMGACPPLPLPPNKLTYCPLYSGYENPVPPPPCRAKMA